MKIAADSLGAFACADDRFTRHLECLHKVLGARRIDHGFLTEIARPLSIVLALGGGAPVLTVRRNTELRNQ